MDIKIVEHDGCVSLYLEVVLEPDGKVYKPVHAIGWLEEKGYKVGKCVKKESKKFTNRPSPPYLANDCKNKKKKGGNGWWWKSVRSRSGKYIWKEIY